MAEITRFTDAEHWDDYWEGLRLPAEVDRDPSTPQVNAILDVFDSQLGPGEGRSALEVGGGSARFLAYLGRRDFRCSVLDISPRGCELARRNFELLGMPLDAHLGDLLDPGLDIGRYDAVYSLGLIEHFDDLTAVVAAHARLVEPGGTLVIGAPNITGVNEWFMKRVCPGRLSWHNPDCLRIERWDEFERALGLERRFRAYVGGFEPRVFAVREPEASSAVWALTRLLVAAFGTRLQSLRRFNPPLLSGYLIAVYRVSGTPSSR
jgi:SAM-dependent methyltransferase